MAASIQSMSDLFGHVIHSYSRAEAIEDGVLIDVSETGKEAGFKIPVAVTDSVWKNYIEWTDEDNSRQTYQDTSGRLWDVIMMARFGMMANKHQSEILYQLDCVPRDGKSKEGCRTTLKVHIGPGDAGEPVLTIMLPGES